MLPDLFGGPDGNVKGKKWEKIKMIIATAYVDDIIHQLGWYEGTESKETQQGTTRIRLMKLKYQLNKQKKRKQLLIKLVSVTVQLLVVFLIYFSVFLI